MQPIAALDHVCASSVKYVLMDIDDTITTEGKLGAEAYQALWSCTKANLITVPITGRPAGWCDLIARQWPVAGVVGENELWPFGRRLTCRRLYHEHAVKNDHEITWEKFRGVYLRGPGARIAQDQFCRMFDLAIDFAEEEPKLPFPVRRRLSRFAEVKEQLQKSALFMSILGWVRTISWGWRYVS